MATIVTRRSPTEFMISWNNGCVSVALPHYCAHAFLHSAIDSVVPYSSANRLFVTLAPHREKTAVFKAQSPQMAERWIGT